MPEPAAGTAVTERSSTAGNIGDMTDIGPSSGKTSLYRFAQPGDVEIETREFGDDDAAEEHARELSTSRQVPVIIERRGHVDWEYLTEADERT